MDGDPVSINFGDYKIWEQRRARLKALEWVANRTQLQPESKYRVYLLLCTAVKEGNVDEFIEALEKCSAEERVSLPHLIDIRGPSGNSLLHVAAGIWKPDILQALLEFICDKKVKPYRGTAAKVNCRGDTALHIAARAGTIRTAELLLDCGSIEDMANDMGNTALHEAVENRHYELTRLLLSRGSSSVYQKNTESKCPLYLAVETGDLQILRLLMEAVDGHVQGMSPVHGAVIHQRIAVQHEETNVIAALGYSDVVNYFLEMNIACKVGHLETIEVLLQHWSDSEELLHLKEGQNMLHVAAKYGMFKVVASMLVNPQLEKLINAKDKEGNTPLHAATLKLQYLVLTSLVLQDVVDLQLLNNGNWTALNVADEQRKKNGLRENLTYAILLTAGTPRSVYKAICQPKGLDPMRALEPRHLDRLKDVADIRMLMATLIAAMTFAAGFSVPGGYNGSGPDAGFATLLNKPMYNVFVICNTVGLHSSIIAVAILHWAETSTFDKMVHDLRIARASVVTALAATSVASMAGVHVTVSKRSSIAVVALIAGITAPFVILILDIVFTPGFLFKLINS